MTDAPQTTDIPHPSVFIQEELDGRGWDRWELARRMGGDYLTRLLEIDLYFEAGPEKTNMRLGKTAENLAVAFDVSAEFFRNMEIVWLRSKGIQP